MADPILRNLVKVECEFAGWERYDCGDVAFYLVRVPPVWAVFDKHDVLVWQHPKRSACLTHVDSALGQTSGRSRPRRRTSVLPGVLPDIAPRSDIDSRVGEWPRGMSLAEIRKRIGPIQRYGDST